ncbi:hypothetical protein H2200_002236 [Cladophialophora chaetospira]|uniref:Uncharacterized protein n=1 Tax=Cladophialophora chaetospira TaxID=386627 RepID=A0AA38XII0_9EURO|nr:hypothetical protein H2200_002236 [Cladophialophora chaetospira]
MTERMKAQIKRRADTRRARQTAQLTTTSIVDQDFILESGKTSRPRRSQTSNDVPGSFASTVGTEGAIDNSSQSYRSTSIRRPPTLEAQRKSPTSPRNDERIPWTASVLGFLDEYEEAHDYLPLLSSGRDFEIDFLMKYLDYVFPLLFPFYQPSLHETGRSWIMTLLRRSRVAFHSAMSLTAYFFVFTLINSYPGQHDDCKGQLWEKIGSQTDMCFEMIQQDIRDLSLRGAQTTLLEKARVMESITQFLIFEVSLSHSANWSLHLTPALALLEEIWQSSTTKDSDSQMLAVLDGMGPVLWFGGPSGGYVWSPEQAGFRFFTGLLLFIDIIASTSLAQPPRLVEYHTHLLADQDSGEPDYMMVPIQFSSLIGCQNWVLLAISQITLLDTWKKDMKRAARLSMMELVDRASHISRILKDGISRLDKLNSSPRKDNPLQLPLRAYINTPLSISSRLSTAPTRIWAHAAQIYLAVAVSGWQPSNAEIRSGVAQILELLRTVDCSTFLRTLAWPLCVAGCMSEAGIHEQEFRHLFAGTDELSMVGALGEARKIIEKVWESRETLDRETWDLAACFRILGTPALLV